MEAGVIRGETAPDELPRARHSNHQPIAVVLQLHISNQKLKKFCILGEACGRFREDDFRRRHKILQALGLHAGEEEIFAAYGVPDEQVLKLTVFVDVEAMELEICA